jgi:hypothetical protein
VPLHAYGECIFSQFEATVNYGTLARVPGVFLSLCDRSAFSHG